MKLIDLKQHSLRYVLLLLFFTASFWSCKKIDVKDSRSVEEHFLTVPANAGPQVKRIIEDLRKKNEAQPFIEAFVATQGYPLWEYATIKKGKHKNNVLAKDDEGDEEIVEVPVVLNDTKFVNAVLNIKLEEDEILYKLFQGKDWQLYGFDKDPNRTRPNANDMVSKIMEYEKLIWGEDIFKVTDNKLFDYWPAGDTKPAAFYIRRKITIDGIIIITVISDCLKPIHDGDLHGVAPGENIPSGFYWGTCTTTWVIQEDDPWDPFGGSGNEASGDLAAWANGGGGGGGSPAGTQNEPCNPDFKWIRMEVRNNQLFNPCLQQVIHIDIPSDGDPSSRDENGFLISRINQLNELLETNPFAIDPCDKLTLMNLATYGPMYQRIAQYTAPDDVVDRLNTLREQQGNWPIDNFNIQSLQDASGPVVNCDYFPIEITQFPTNASGIPMTPAEFLEFFRMNVNQFITDPVTVNFSCYISPSLDDCIQWQQPGASSLGALNTIHIAGNNGSVILSDYQNIYNANSQQHYFKFTTIESPFDNEHPVAGNREWGLFNNANGPANRFTFYSMAVDRTWDWPSALANQAFGGFERADELWSNMQENLIEYINHNGGVAGYYAERNYIARPNWNDVKAFLMGDISLERLKEILGC